MTAVYEVELALEFTSGKFINEFYNVVAEDAGAAVEGSMKVALESKSFTKVELNAVKKILTVDIIVDIEYEQT